MAKSDRSESQKRITRYTHEDVKEPRTPETGHTSLLPDEEQTVSLPMDNGWSGALVNRCVKADQAATFSHSRSAARSRLIAARHLVRFPSSN
ncbi:MAG: hypothetical protein ACK47B_28320, partial [Armatimonadota bacterium]